MAIMANRVMIERFRDLVDRRESFAPETTCSGRIHLPLPRRRSANDDADKIGSPIQNGGDF